MTRMPSALVAAVGAIAVVTMRLLSWQVRSAAGEVFSVGDCVAIPSTPGAPTR